MMETDVWEMFTRLGISEGAVAGLAAAAFLFWAASKWWSEMARLRAVSAESYLKQLATLETSLEHERHTRRADIEAERSARREDVARLEAHIRTLKADLTIKAEEKHSLQQQLNTTTDMMQKLKRHVEDWVAWSKTARSVVSALTDALDQRDHPVESVPSLPPLPKGIWASGLQSIEERKMTHVD